MAGNPEGKRKRLLIMASALMLLIAAGTFGRMTYLQRRAKSAGVPRVMQAATPDLTPQEKARSIARARELREKWRPWALRHRAQLTRMMNAKPGDKAAFAVAWDTIPMIPDETGITGEDLAPQGVQPPSPVGFGWGGISKVTIGSDNPTKLSPKVLKTVQQGQNYALEMVRDDFDKHRDIIIASSLTARTATHLWASGRITQSGLLPANRKREMIDKAKAEGRNFQFTDMQTPHQPIEPPYDFLPSTSHKEQT